MAPGGAVMSLTGTTIVWRGLTLFGRAELGRFSINSLEGWEDLPAPRQDSTARPQTHGKFDARVFSDERHVTISGRCNSITERDAMLLELKAVFNYHATDELPLVITNAGRTLTAYARLLRFKSSSPDWGGGFIDWAAEWACSDPLRYGDPISEVRTFVSLTGGLEYDLYTDSYIDTGYLDYGSLATTSRLTLTNPGDEDVWPQFEIVGPIPIEGFEIAHIGTGDRIRFEGAVPTGSTLVLDSATGTVLIDGYADRSGLLTVRDWVPIPAGGSAEFEFVALGAYSAAVLTATFSPGWW